MTIYGVLGPTGFTGRLVLCALADAGHTVRLGARDVTRARAVIPTGLSVASVEPADVRDPASLDRFLAGVDVVLTTVGPFAELGGPVVEAAIRAGVPYVDSAAEQPFLRLLRSRFDEPARSAGVPLVPASGFDFLPGDLLASRACAHVTDPDEVHVAYALPRTSDLLLGWSRGTRRSLARVVGEPMVAVVEGQLREEHPGEHRRLAWFPRPAGPRHAAAIPGGEPLSVPAHVPGLATVRTYLALPSLAAELLQGGATWGRRPWVRERLAGLMARPSDPSDARRSSTRWACVAEAHGADGVGRAWAYGTDLYDLTAHAMVVVAERLAAGIAATGVLAPAQVGAAGDLLDALATRTGLKWSVVTPTSGESPATGASGPA